MVLTLIAVGFLVVTAVVIALARGSTARWEQNKRASVAARADGPAWRTSPAGAALRRPSAMAGRGLAALRSRASRFPPVEVLAQLVPKAVKRTTARVPPFRRLAGVLRSPLGGGRWAQSRSTAAPVDGDEADTALAPKPSEAEDDGRSGGVAGGARRRLLRRAAPRAPRRALAFLHRHDHVEEVRVPPADRDESPTAP